MTTNETFDISHKRLYIDIPPCMSEFYDLRRIEINGTVNFENQLHGDNICVRCETWDDGYLPEQLIGSFRNNVLQSGTLSIDDDRIFTFDKMQSTRVIDFHFDKQPITQLTYMRFYLFQGTFYCTSNDMSATYTGKFLQHIENSIDKFDQQAQQRHQQIDSDSNSSRNIERQKDCQKTLDTIDPLGIYLIDFIYFASRRLFMFDGTIKSRTTCKVSKFNYDYDIQVRGKFKIDSNVKICREYAENGPFTTKLSLLANWTGTDNFDHESDINANNPVVTNRWRPWIVCPMECDIEACFLVNNLNRKNNRISDTIAEFPGLPKNLRSAVRYATRKLHARKLSSNSIYDFFLTYKGNGLVSAQVPNISNEFILDSKGKLLFQTNFDDGTVRTKTIFSGKFHQSSICFSSFIEKLKVFGNDKNKNNIRQICQEIQLIENKFECQISFDHRKCFQSLCNKIAQLMKIFGNSDNSEQVSFSILMEFFQRTSISQFEQCCFDEILFSSKKFDCEMVGLLYKTNCVPLIDHLFKLRQNSMNGQNINDWITKLCVLF